ncbi:ATP-binding protein [Planomonospora sp. ID82291]|uniref:ATP-binding protein n=1 Tax=Planomonospora sp. ID82291 TaxID=2738136 RepID=UPI0018C36407|nr:ATP-binding protein [Planomonospora sp. ID82291]MBG0817720.1 GAF domain-containing protein [Planomonospora sp. ID82291]
MKTEDRADTAEDRVGEARRIEALHATGLLDVPRMPLLDRVTRMATRLLDVPVARISLIAGDRQVTLSAEGSSPSPPERQSPLSQSVCRHLVLDDAPLAVTDTRGDERWRDIVAVFRGEPAAYAGVPVHEPGGQALGALCVIDHRPRPWSPEELRTLEELAVTAEAVIAAWLTDRELRRQLEDERTFLSALLDSLNAPVVYCDGDGVLVRFNRPMREILQASEQPIAIEEWAPAFGLFAADGRTLLPGDRVPLARALAGERFGDQQVVVRTPGDPSHRFLVNGRPVETADGRRLGAMITGQDITGQHRVRMFRDAQHAVLKALAEADSVERASCGVIGAIAGAFGWSCGEYWQVDPGGKRISRTGSWVEPGRDLSGFTGPELMTVRPGQGLPGRVWASGRGVWVRDLHTEPGGFLRTPHALHAGLHTAVGLPVRSGERVLAVLTFFADAVEERDDDLLYLLDGVGAHIGRFMERRRAEDLALALTTSRRRFDQVVAQLDDLVWTVEIDDGGRARRTYQSQSTAGILGGHVPLGIDVAAFTESRVHPDDLPAFHELHRAVASGRPGRAEYRVIGLDGVTRWIWTRATPRREGGRLMADGICTDVTERHRLEEELGRLLAREQEQVHRLRDLDRMKDELVALVSHEIRSPVAVIRSYAEMLADVPGLEDEPRMFADVIDRRSTHLQQLVDDLLDLARLDAGQVAVDPRPVSLTRLVRQAVDDHRAAAAAKDLTITTDLAVHLPVHADPVRLRQVLDNLLSNAVKYTPAGGAVTVTAGCDGGSGEDGHGGGDEDADGDGDGDGGHRAEECVSGAVAVTVADTGIGVPAEEYPRLFDRFFRASTAQEAGIKGTGLGLAVTRAIVEAHGGSVAAAPREGGGTVFTVRLPAADPDRRTPGPAVTRTGGDPDRR